VGYLAHMAEIINVHKLLVGRSEGRKPSERPRDM
jgi:hypothetical protein